jgi:hypothetical protein
MELHKILFLAMRFTRCYFGPVLRSKESLVSRFCSVKAALVGVLLVPSASLAEELRINSDDLTQFIQAMPDPAECLRHPTQENCGRAYQIITQSKVLDALKGKIGIQ